ncbi:MAG: hypothetical protein A3F67_11810 [Verrucomicrobia bacterium RIFCSPHIGHO2_12_FULL_41_10]|nr:MAG: hypothetical protein A3F67_11810 [Verrucomicrobia bacterium RIFCSPHIGHO2_12_FULL_41_10]HLB57392.1 NAD-dependent epimerase/dehydratase family protein [Gammaproteobacteria bacterium]
MLLITGHKGFVGSNLCVELKRRGLDFVGYDLQDGDDIRDKCKLDRFFEENQVTEIVHLAALAGVRRGELYPADYIFTNILGTNNLVELAEKYGVKKIVFFSSSSVYGQGKPPIKEDDAKKPISIYGITKLAGEKIIERCKIPFWVILRPFTIYGENGRRDEVIYKWVNQVKNKKPITVYGNGGSERGYVYIKDIVSVVLKILFEKHAVSKMDLNIGGSEVIKLSEIIAEFKKVFLAAKFETLPLPESDVKSNFANITKAGDWLEFNPKKKFIKNLRLILKKEKKNL